MRFCENLLFPFRIRLDERHLICHCNCGLLRLALAYELPVATLLGSYARARSETAAANPELDALIASG